MDYACHAYANAMQLRTKHLRCYNKDMYMQVVFIQLLKT
jgi:hypothetical protein